MKFPYEFKDKLVTSFLAFENQTDIDSPIHEIRVEAIKEFEERLSLKERRMAEI